MRRPRHRGPGPLQQLRRFREGGRRRPGQLPDPGRHRGGHDLPAARQGHAAAGPRGRPGDVYVTVRTAADPRFTRQGADLWHRLEIPVYQAVLGATPTVPGPDGPVPLTVPPGTQPGAVLDLPGLGLPRADGRGRGSLRVSVAVRIPEHPGEEEQELYRRLAALHAPHPPATRGVPSQTETGTLIPEPPGADRTVRHHWWHRWWRRRGGGPHGGT
ncbi:J domain-containing protein [Kitasatospora arboriphila]